MRWFQFRPSEQVYRNNVIYFEESAHIETVYTRGTSYGAALCEAWRRATTHASRPKGICVLEWDVAVEPADMDALEAQAAKSPDRPATGLVHLHHDTTGLDRVVYGHRNVATQGWPTLHFGNASDTTADAASLACCYLPRWLFDQHGAEVERFVYPSCDTNISKLFYDAGKPYAVVHDCLPKHVHWTRLLDWTRLLGSGRWL